MGLKKGFIGITFLLILLIHNSIYGQGEMQAKNLKNRYDPRAEIKINHKAVNLSDRTLLFLKLTIRHNRTRLEDLTASYAYLDRYSGSLVFSEDTLRLSNYWINNISNQHFFNLEILNSSQRRILILRVHNRVTDNEFYFDVNIDPKPEILNSGIIVNLPNQNLPYFSNYVKSSEEWKIRNYKTSDSTHYVYRYIDNFSAASPPFSTNDEGINRELKIDSSFVLKSGKVIHLNSPGLHFIQHDTTGVNGLAFRSEAAHFPREGSYDELIESLVYFSTNSEMSKLETANDKKKAFDAYWLGVANSPDKAKKVIKEYYRRVRQANELFTTYKQGWKTDKGMIFIIFGPPDGVYKGGKKEEWIYERNAQLPRISFEFQKIDSIFTLDHYVLLRKKSYQQIWYKAIDLWRKGQKEI